MHTSWLRLGVALIGVLALSVSALAMPLPGAAIESSLARFLLSETDDGIALMGRFLGRSASASDIDEFLRGVREAGPGRDHVRHELEVRIGRLREELHRARVARNGGRKTAESDRFTPEEQLVLRAAAKRELSLSEHALPADPQPGQIRFAEGERIGLESSREEFLNPSFDVEPLDNAPKSIRREARKGFKTWASDAQTCLDRRPDKLAKSSEKRDLFQQLAITASVNTGAYLFTSGISHFDAGSFSVDMLISLLSTGVSMSWMKHKDTFRVRWLKVYSWGRVRTRLDAELYQIFPWTDTHGMPMADAVIEREDFNRSWGTQTSIINPIMFSVLSGAECLIDEARGAAAAARFAKGAFAVKFGVSVGMTFLYFKVRSDRLHSTGVSK